MTIVLSSSIVNTCFKLVSLLYNSNVVPLNEALPKDLSLWVSLSIFFIVIFVLTTFTFKEVFR